MALTRGAFRAFDHDRMVVLFTMMNGDAEIACAISTAAMDDLEKPFKASASQREAQFLRLRDRIESRIAETFAAKQGSSQAEIVLRSNDFWV